MRHRNAIPSLTFLSVLTPFLTGQAPADAAPSATLSPLSQRVAAANDFAFAMQRQLDPGNSFCSPYSVSAAFAICWAATNGETHADIGKVLLFGQEAEVVHRTTAELQKSLTPSKAPYELAVANRLWGNQGESAGYYQQPFLQAMQRHYGACFESVDFSVPDAARTQINGWVSEQTRTRIPNLIPEGGVDASTVFVITNAVYFKATWQRAFDAKLTKEGEFRVDPEHAVKVPLMHQSGEFESGRVDECEALALPYEGGALRMLVLLPNQGVAELEQSLSHAMLGKVRASLRKQRLGVTLPRFQMSTAYPLHEKVLPALGMKAPFAPSNDWAPLNGGKEPLAISSVYHNAFVAVDEQGTEAAAATAIVAIRGGRPKSFVANRPFVFVIEHVETGLLLFVGRVQDPAK